MTYRDILAINPSSSIGIELEFEMGNLRQIEKSISAYNVEDVFGKKWHIKEESYTRHGIYGGELVSSVFYNTKKDWKTFKNMVKTLQLTSAISTKKTSFQVSIGKKAFDKNILYLYRFILLWSYYEDITYRFVAGEQDTVRDKVTTRAVPCGDLLIDFAFHYQNMQKELSIDAIFQKLSDILDGKKYGINIDTLDPQKDRIELRPANSSLKEEILQNIILYYLSLIDATKNDKLPWEELEQKAKQTFLCEPYVSPIQTRLFFPPYRLYAQNILRAREDTKKAEELSHMIFKNNMDKESFMKQYTKKI